MTSSPLLLRCRRCTSPPHPTHGHSSGPARMFPSQPRLITAFELPEASHIPEEIEVPRETPWHWAGHLTV